MYVCMYMDIYVHTYLGGATYVYTHIGVLTIPGHSQVKEDLCWFFAVMLLNRDPEENQGLAYLDLWQSMLLLEMTGSI
jgi:hypothetical protein